MIPEEPDAAPGYTVYQSEFIERFTREAGTARTHLLLAPVGTGKSFAMASAVAGFAAKGRQRRVLVLTMAALAEQWVDRFHATRRDVVLLDGRTTRLLRERLGNDAAALPPGIFVIGIDAAKRSGSSQFFAGIPWDLVVVDDAHRLTGQRQEFVERLLAQTPKPGLLMATHIAPAHSTELTDGAVVIDWTEAVIRARAERTDQPDIQRFVRKYRRSEEEIEFLGAVVAYVRPLGTASGLALLRRAASSIACLEDALLHSAHDRPRGFDDSSATDDLLRRLDSLGADSRLESFQALVSELSAEGVRHTVVFCDYRSTLEYVAAALEPQAIDVYRLDGSLSASRRHEALHNFKVDGGVLVMTSALEGLSLSFATAVIHYDLPSSPVAFARRRGRYDRYGRTNTCRVYLFEDESNALSFEAILLRMQAKVDIVTANAVLDEEELFRESVGNRP